MLPVSRAGARRVSLAKNEVLYLGITVFAKKRLPEGSLFGKRSLHFILGSKLAMTLIRTQ